MKPMMDAINKLYKLSVPANLFEIGTAYLSSLG